MRRSAGVAPVRAVLGGRTMPAETVTAGEGGMQLNVESVFREADRFCAEVSARADLGRKVLLLSLYALGGSALYGLTMGMSHSLAQAVSSAVKVPTLFLLTLLICLPTLHFIGLLFGSRIGLAQSLVVLLAGIAMTSILLAAFAPISLLFLASGSDYAFLLFLHVAIFAFCGAAGLWSVTRNYARLRAAASAAGAGPDHVMKVWVFLYMFVGTQTAFVLSPFVGRGEFQLFGAQKKNFYTYLWSVLQELLAKA
jgi:hypothetical protein